MIRSMFELIDVEKGQRILDSVCDAIGISAAIIDLTGNVLVKPRCQRICKHFHRLNERTLKKRIESDTRLANALQQGKRAAIYQCPNGLTDAAVPVVVEGVHIANAFAGQFFLRTRTAISS